MPRDRVQAGRPGRSATRPRAELDPNPARPSTCSEASWLRGGLTVLWSLTSELYESFKNGGVDIATFFAADPALQFEFRRIVEDGEFWESPVPNARSLQLVPLTSAVPGRLPEILKVLRDGFAHFHWRYENLSAQDYWTRQGWDTASPQPALGLAARSAENYRAYIVDAKLPWDSGACEM